VTRFVTLAGLNLRELWMSFGLLLILAMLLGSALVLLLVSVSAPDLSAATAYAVALAIATMVAAVVGAHGVATERRDGAAAWLVVRAVPRSALLLARLAAFVPPLLIGLLVSAIVAWLTLASSPAFAKVPVAFALAVGAAGAGALAAVSLGMLLGTLLPPRRAALATALILGGVAGASVLLPPTVPLPAGGFTLLGSLPSVTRPIEWALIAAGSSLIAVALLTACAGAVLQRTDL
jgi:hypothetical protein